VCRQKGRSSLSIFYYLPESNFLIERPHPVMRFRKQMPRHAFQKVQISIAQRAESSDIHSASQKIQMFIAQRAIAFGSFMSWWLSDSVALMHYGSLQVSLKLLGR